MIILEPLLLIDELISLNSYVSEQKLESHQTPEMNV